MHPIVALALRHLYRLPPSALQAKLDFQKAPLFAPASAVAQLAKAEREAQQQQQQQSSTSPSSKTSSSGSLPPPPPSPSSSIAPTVQAAAAHLAATTHVGHASRAASLYDLVPVPVPYITANYAIFANVFMEEPTAAAAAATAKPAAASPTASTGAGSMGAKSSSSSDSVSLVHAAAAAAAIASPISGIVPTIATSMVKEWGKGNHTPAASATGTGTASASVSVSASATGTAAAGTGAGAAEAALNSSLSSSAAADADERIYLSGRSAKYGAALHWHPFFSNVPPGTVIIHAYSTFLFQFLIPKSSDSYVTNQLYFLLQLYFCMIYSTICPLCPPSLSSGPMLLIAQEFFDALPVHSFVYTERGWLERLVDVDVSPSGYVLPRHDTESIAFTHFVSLCLILTISSR